MSNRFSLDEAKLELRNRGYYVVGNSRKGYRVFKDGIDHTTLVTGWGVVKFAKEVLINESNQSYIFQSTTGSVERSLEMLAEMRSTWDPGTKVVNVLTGETVVI